MSSKVSCKYHPDAPLIEDYRAGDQICSDCGIVVGDRFVPALINTFPDLGSYFIAVRHILTT